MPISMMSAPAFGSALRFKRGRRIRIAGHQEGDESRAALFFQFGKPCVDAGGHNAAFAVLHLSPTGKGRLRSSRVRGMDKFKARDLPAGER